MSIFEKWKYAKCTILPKNVEDKKKKVFNLSTLEKPKSVENLRFSKSYPHYPHKKLWILWITLKKKRTSVLVSSDEIRCLSKKEGNFVDI